ncbi:hypothetical protein GCM10018953_53440 [Streptosporangium nondiastaticum]|uniref:hypothetical protein n=1 Tax=Streptosporangium nondiastaticum TaxID=35764 RepID=UPI0031F9FD4D
MTDRPGVRVALWAAAEVAAIAAVIGATMGVTHLTDASAAAPAEPARLSGKPGAFAVPVDLCKQIAAADLRKLLPAVNAKGVPLNTGGCAWAVPGVGLRIDPLGNGQAKPWGKSPREAHELLVNQRNGTLPTGTILWSWSEIKAAPRSTRTTGPLPVKPVGDEAFGYDYYENRKTGRLEQSHVVFRVDNLVLDVGYTVVDGSKDAPAIQAGAHTAATWIANALNKQKASG